MSRAGRNAVVRAAAAVTGVLAIAGTFAAWLTPDSVVSLIGLAAFCR